MKARIRKLITVVEEIEREGGLTLERPSRRAAAIAVIENPLSGMYSEDLSQLIDIGEELGDLLARKALAAIAEDAFQIESYGKAAIVGEAGELEHAAAILHPKLGGPFRAVLGHGAALIPSSKKRGGLDCPIDIPLGHKDAAYVRSHFDGMEVHVPDAPRSNEIVVALAITDSGRPLARIGGLSKDEIVGKDGLR
ncbi:MAG TPA: amino acid synthesis family protein [Stellaceae bacterium]|nr:amino acid synthesis family protein [Stellaceae bacterium]